MDRKNHDKQKSQHLLALVSLLFDNLLLALVSLLFDKLLLALVSLLFDNLLLATHQSQ
jgi:hypothetical protein